MSANLPSFQIAARSHPSQGARAIQAALDFTVLTVVQGDFFFEEINGHIDFIQSVKIDNSANASPFTIVFPGVGSLGDKIVVPPNTQGVYPVTSPLGKLSYVASSAGGVVVSCIFYNIEQPYYQASSIAPPNPTPTVITGADNNFSGACTGADVAVIPANAARKRVVIQNSPANNTSIWVRSGAAATMDNNSQEIQPGQEYDTAQGPISLTAIHIIGANGVTYYANEII